MDKDKSSELLAAIIVSNRVIGLFVDESRSAMIELMTRRQLGSDFDFETYINEKIKQITPEKSSNVDNNLINNSISLIQRFSRE
jgi:hypothetical protein